MFYKSMFYKSMFYKSMFYKSISSPVYGPVHVLQHAHMHNGKFPLVEMDVPVNQIWYVVIML
jgi:hypothetical protein